MSSTECPSSLNFEPRPTPVQQNDTLLTQQTLAIHGYDECHRRVPFDAFWWSLPDRLQTVEMHIFCRKQLCFRPKTKKTKSTNTFSPEIETDRKQSKSLFSAPETKTKFGQSLLPILFSRQRSLRDFGISCFLQLLPVCFQHMLTAEDRVTDSITQGIYYAFSSCVYIV